MTDKQAKIAIMAVYLAYMPFLVWEKLSSIVFNKIKYNSIKI